MIVSVADFAWRANTTAKRVLALRTVLGRCWGTVGAADGRHETPPRGIACPPELEKRGYEIYCAKAELPPEIIYSGFSQKKIKKIGVKTLVSIRIVYFTN